MSLLPPLVLVGRCLPVFLDEWCTTTTSCRAVVCPTDLASCVLLLTLIKPNRPLRPSACTIFISAIYFASLPPSFKIANPICSLFLSLYCTDERVPTESRQLASSHPKKRSTSGTYGILGYQRSTAVHHRCRQRTERTHKNTGPADCNYDRNVNSR